MKTILKTQILSCLLLFSPFSQATITITGNLSYDDISGLITSSSTGIQYYNWTDYAGLNYAQTVAEFNDNPLRHFHIATQTEAYEFYNQATLSNAVDHPGVQSFFYHDSILSQDQFGNNNNPTNSIALFLSNETSEVGTIQSSGSRLALNDSFFQIAQTDQYSSTGSSPSFPLTWLLVSDSTTSPVPVPAAVWLMGSGLVGLMGFSRKNKA